MGRAFDLDAAAWTTLRGLLDEAIALAPAQRAAWLDGLDGRGHAALKPRLSRLLAHAQPQAAPVWLDTLPKLETGAFAPLPPHDADLAGASVGPYRLLREIGSGGMASVWLAERSDMLQRRRVALKLPHGAWRRAGLAERLAREREILAALEHPNIARLYDAGVADGGQPYLALEYVEGERIDAHCRRKALDVAARLRLVIQAARAVAHAHARLVVHRDLKPSNILVTEAGDVKLLDFGIAKLLDQGVAEETALTRDAGRALTPEYAAPEQIGGGPITTATDVYALGVLLAELLCGRRPYVLARGSRAALEDAIAHAEPARPSALAGSPRLKRQLRGDLDTIVLKALKKQPAQRYATAEAFADDLQRHLDRQPVLARPDHAAYRLRRFVARHRLVAAAATAVALALVAGAGVATWQARVAQSEQRRADEVRRFVVSIFSGANPVANGGRPLAAKDLLVRATARIDAIGPERSALRVELLAVTGESMLGLGEPGSAEPIARRAVDEATRRLGAAHPLTLRARLLLADVHRWRGRADAMRRELAALLPALQRQGDAQPEALARALALQAHLAIDEARFHDAVASARQAFELALARLGPGDPRTVELSSLHAEAQQYETLPAAKALAAAERGLRFAEAAYPGAAAHPHVIHMREVYARALAMHGQDDAAVAEARRALADARAVFGPGSPLEGIIAGNMVPALRRIGAIREAIASGEQALAVAAGHFARDSRTHGMFLTGLGVTWLAARRGERALPPLDEALAVLRRVLPETSAEVLTAALNRARALAYAGRSAEALRAIGPLVDAYGVHVPQHLAYALHVRGQAERLAGLAGDALASQRASLAAAPDDRLHRMRVLPELGLAQLALQRPADALATLDEALALIEAHEREPTPLRAEAWLGKGRALWSLGRAADAAPWFARADDFWRGFDAASRGAGEAAFWRARADARLGRHAEARAGLARARALLARHGLPADAGAGSAPP